MNLSSKASQSIQQQDAEFREIVGMATLQATLQATLTTDAQATPDEEDVKETSMFEGFSELRSNMINLFQLNGRVPQLIQKAKFRIRDGCKYMPSAPVLPNASVPRK
jgi:hypothetical protein